MVKGWLNKESSRHHFHVRISPELSILTNNFLLQNLESLFTQKHRFLKQSASENITLNISQVLINKTTDNASTQTNPVILNIKNHKDKSSMFHYIYAYWMREIKLDGYSPVDWQAQYLHLANGDIQFSLHIHNQHSSRIISLLQKHAFFDSVEA